MRIALLSAVILFAFFTFWFPSQKEGQQLDSVKMMLSAPARTFAPKRATIAKASLVESVEDEGHEDEEPEGEADISATSESDADSELEHVDEVAVDDHEKGWQDELSQVIVNLEPEFGEEMFNSYVTERNNFQSALDELIRGNQKNQDLELLIGELENKHEERVKEVFGRHYEDIKDQQSKFFETESP